MDFNLVYAQGQSYYEPNNPYHEIEKLLVEKNGVYYNFEKECNWHHEKFTVEVVKMPEKIPAVYEIRENSYYKWCRHGGKVNIKLSKYNILDNNEFLLSAKAEEIFIIREIYLGKQIEENYIYSEEYIFSLGLNQEELTFAKAWREKIMVEAMMGIPLSKYSAIFEKMANICKEKAVVVCHSVMQYVKNLDYIINNRDVVSSDYHVKGFPLLFPNHFSPISFEVYNLSKEVEIEPGLVYIGSYNFGINIMVVVNELGKGFKIYHKPWAEVISYINTFYGDKYMMNKFFIKNNEFFIETGCELIFDKQNLNFLEEEHKDVYLFNQIKDVKNVFDLTWNKIKELIEEIGIEKGLSIILDLKSMNLTEQELQQLSKKNSDLELDNFFEKRGLEKPKAKLSEITNATIKFLEIM